MPQNLTLSDGLRQLRNMCGTEKGAWTILTSCVIS